MNPHPRIQKYMDEMLDRIVTADRKESRELTEKLFKRLTREPNRRLAKRSAKLTEVTP